MTQLQGEQLPLDAKLVLDVSEMKDDEEIIKEKIKKLTSINCFNCGHEIHRRKIGRHACPKCHSNHWKAPSLFQRIDAAINAFNRGR